MMSPVPRVRYAAVRANSRGMPPTFSDRSPLVVESSLRRDVGRLRLAGELDVLSAPALVAEVDALLHQPVHTVAIDAAGVSFIDSAGLRALITAHRRAGQLGVDLVVDDPSPSLGRVLEVTGLAPLLSRT
jgi:anti-sigma B factor antagonist